MERGRTQVHCGDSIGEIISFINIKAWKLVFNINPKYKKEPEYEHDMSPLICIIGRVWPSMIMVEIFALLTSHHNISHENSVITYPCLNLMFFVQSEQDNPLTSYFFCPWNSNLALWHEMKAMQCPSVPAPKAVDAMQGHVLRVYKWRVCDPAERRRRAAARCH